MESVLLGSAKVPCSGVSICLGLGVIFQRPGRTGGSSLGVSPGALCPQVRFSEVLVKWRSFFHQMAAEQGQAGQAVLDTKLEVEKLQVRQVMPAGGGCAAGMHCWRRPWTQRCQSSPGL